MRTWHCLVWGVTLIVACAPPREPLPGPVRPFTPTPDASFRSGPPPPDGETRALAPPELELMELPGGLTVAVVRATGPISAVGWSSRGARGCGRPGEAGLAALTLRMLLRGTRLSDGRVLRDPRVAGVPVRALTAVTHGMLLIEPLAQTLPLALGLVAEVQGRPVFDEVELGYARVDHGEAAYARSYRVSTHLSSAVVEKLRGADHCVAQSLLGHVKGIEGYERAHVEGLYRRAFGLGGSLLVVVTERPTDEIVAAAARQFVVPDEGAPSLWPPLPPHRSPPRRDRVVVMLGGEGLAAWMVGFPAPGSGHPDALPMALVAHVLGASSVSRANLALRHREAGTYGVGARYASRAEGGELLVGSSCEAKDSVRAVHSLLAEAERLRREPVTPEELEAARAQYLAGVSDALSTPSGVVQAIADLHAVGAPLGHYSSLEERVFALSPMDLKTAAVQWLDPSRAQIAVYGRLERQMVELQALGEVELHRLREIE